MPRSVCRKDIHWSLPPKDCCVLEESLSAPLGQFYSLYTHRMMQKATEPQAQRFGFQLDYLKILYSVRIKTCIILLPLGLRVLQSVSCKPCFVNLPFLNPF